MKSAVLDPSAAEVASVTLAAVVTTIGPVPMIVLVILAGARTVVRAVARRVDGSVGVAGETVLVAVRLWVLVRQFRGVQSRATRIWTKSVGAVVAS